MKVPTCTFCSETAREEYVGTKASGGEAIAEAAYACWRNRHKTKAKAYLMQRGYVDLQERVL